MNIYQKNKEQMYPVLVSKYIRERYSLDSEFAVINNYNLDPVKYAEDYQAYQAYRLECKERAKKELGETNE